MTGRGRLGVLGGTFDPIHLGHLSAALTGRRALALDEVLLIPSHQPPHRSAPPQVSTFHRFAMVSLATMSDPCLVASDFELMRPGLSYTAVTLRALHAEGHAASQIFFIIGIDAFADIATWHDYPAVLGFAHFAIVSRPGQSFDVLRARLPGLSPEMIDVGFYPPSAAQTSSPHIFLVRGDTPDVSSTDIRQRAARGASLAGLVPPEVERHIERHRLYASRKEVSSEKG